MKVNFFSTLKLGCRSIWVEWDEPGCCDKQNREQQTEWGNLIKRRYTRVPEIGNGNSFPYSISNLCLEQLVNMLLKPQLVNHAGTLAALQQQSAANGDLIAYEDRAGPTQPKESGCLFRSLVNPLSVFDLQDSSAVLTEANNSSLTSIGQEMWDNSLNNCRFLPHVDQLTSSHRDRDFHNPSDCLVGNLSSSQDLQSQFTSASLGNSQAFSRQDPAGNSGHANKLGSEVIHI
ncbi:hypothetical protein GBA52_008439 [Prunus armeniaca]|nr:hypothetical protein GBA52_008439 [Prunus armeniaca]